MYYIVHIIYPQNLLYVFILHQRQNAICLVFYCAANDCWLGCICVKYSSQGYLHYKHDCLHFYIFRCIYHFCWTWCNTLYLQHAYFSKSGHLFNHSCCLHATYYNSLQYTKQSLNVGPYLRALTMYTHACIYKHMYEHTNHARQDAIVCHLCSWLEIAQALATGLV